MNESNNQTSVISSSSVPEKDLKPPQIHSSLLLGIRKKLLPLLLVAGGIIFGAGMYFAIQKFTTKPPDPIVTTVIVTPTPTPTPLRYPTNISTTSAFIALEEVIASFSAKLDEFSKEDPSLSPPNLILPLGL